MSYLRHLRACNDWNPADFVPLYLGSRRVGHVMRDRVAGLGHHPTVFEISADRVLFVAGLEGPALTAALGEVAGALAAKGLIGGLRGEPFAVTEGWGGRHLFDLDRGAVPFFGTRSYGVHLNGYVLGEAGLRLWVGLRAADKKIAPGKLDNLVAGGIGAGYGIKETLVKESGEEAGLDPVLAGRAHPVGAITYRMRLADGMRDDVLYLYDLALDPSVLPRPNDDEVVRFDLMPVDTVLTRVRETDDFKFNVNLVLIDFAIRHGLIPPDHPEYLALIEGLRGGLIRGLPPF